MQRSSKYSCVCFDVSNVYGNVNFFASQTSGDLYTKCWDSKSHAKIPHLAYHFRASEGEAQEWRQAGSADKTRIKYDRIAGFVAEQVSTPAASLVARARDGAHYKPCKAEVGETTDRQDVALRLISSDTMQNVASAFYVDAKAKKL
jgi:hypothetical protein